MSRAGRKNVRGRGTPTSLPRPSHSNVLSPSRLKVYRIAQITNHVCEKVGHYTGESLRRKACESVCVRSVAGIRRTHNLILCESGCRNRAQLWETVQ